MRIAVVAPRYLEVGGMQNYARRVVGWAQQRHDVLVVGTHAGWRTREEWHDGVRVILLGTWLTLSNTPVNPLWYFQLRRIFRKHRIDVVNAHSPVPYLADMAILAAGRRRSTVLTYHAGSLVKGTGGVVDAILRAYERILLPRVFARATKLVAVSPIAMTAHTGRAETITPGVDTAVFRPGPVRSTRSIAYVGRVERTSRWKGLHVLLDALAQLPDTTLEVVGDGDLVPELQEQTRRLGVAGRVVWHGALDAAGVNTVLQRVGVTVLPSLTEAESFGMSLIEAMAAGCPVVASEVGGIPHVVRNGVDGLLVPPGDAGALARAIASVLDDIDLADQLGYAGRAAAEQRWDWRHQEERTMRTLESARVDRLRLAVVTDAVSPWSTGGKEQRQHELLTRLAARGVQVDVYTMRWWGSGNKIVQDGITFHALCPLVPLYTKGGRRSIVQALAFALSTLRMITRRYDVLEVDAIPFLQLFPARIVAWLRRKPMVVTWHEYWGSQYWTDYLGPLGRLAAFVERTAIRLPDRILAASEGTAERLRAEGATDVHVVTPGISAAALVAATAPRPASDELQLLYAGRLLDHKRVDVAIGACAQLVARGVPARLTVIGAGPHAAALRNLARGLPVEFLDFLPQHSDVLARMAAADMFVFPSVREGFGMVALEAMAMGTPVITSDHPDNFARHLIEPGVNGFACAPDAASFADAIEAAQRHLPDLSAGATTVAARFDWDRIADRARRAYA